MISAPVVCPLFIDRHEELAFLIERRRELSKTHGGLVFVSGDAGIGKSRLLREFLDRTGKSRGRVAVGRCRPFATAPYEPLTDLLAAFAPEAARLSPAQTEAAQLKSIADALLGAAQKHAIVAIIEDLHWSDNGTLAVLALLAERLATSRMLLIATYRAGELGPQHPNYIALASLLRSRSVASITLAPLDGHHSRQFIDAALQTAPEAVPLDLRREVARIAEGNPFFTEELLKDVVDRRRIERGAYALPTTINAAILEHVGPLSAADRAVLTHAAVIGRQFDAALLADTLETDAAAVLPVLQRARALQIVDESAAPSTFRFRHALTREAIYGQLLAAQRQPLHRRIALGLEGRTDAAAAPQALAYHWWAAGDRVKALEYGERGGDAAQALHAHADAVAAYERTLSLLDAASADAARVRVKAGLSYGRSGFMDRAIEQYRIAWDWCRINGDATFMFRVATLLADSLYNDGQVRDSIGFLQSAVELILRRDDPVVSASARLKLASYLVDSGDIAGTRAVLSELDAAVVDADLRLTSLRLETTASLCHLEGDAEGAGRAADMLCGLPDDGVDRNILLNGLTEAGLTALFTGATAAAWRCLDRAAELCLATQMLPPGGQLAALAIERALSGAFDEAGALAARGLATVGDVTVNRYVALNAALMVADALGDRELQPAEPDAEAIDRALTMGIPFLFGPLAALCARLRAQRGDRAAAADLLRRALAAAEAALPKGGSFPLVVVAAQLGERADRPAIERFCARSAAGGPAPRAAADLALAILLRRFGDSSAVVSPAQRAASGFAAVGWPLFEALARETAGDGAAADRLRVRIGVAPSSAPGAAAGEAPLRTLLTPREFDVAKLVAGGSTNREIAAALNVSVKLVEKLLSAIYAKLEVTSRSQLTAYYIARDLTPPVRR